MILYNINIPIFEISLMTRELRTRLTMEDYPDKELNLKASRKKTFKTSY